MIVNVTKKIRSTRIVFAIEYKREKMRYFKFTHIVETTTAPPIVNVSYAYQIIPTNKTKVRKIYCKSIVVAKIAHISYILSKYYAEHFSTFRVESSRSKGIKMVPKCHLTLLVFSVQLKTSEK